MAEETFFVIDVDGKRRPMTDEEIAVLPLPPAVTQDDYSRSIQTYVDATAKVRLYNDGNSLASYKDSTIPKWAAEASAFIAWRDQVYVYANEQMNLFLSGERDQPSLQELIEELPKIEWPEESNG